MGSTGNLLRDSATAKFPIRSFGSYNETAKCSSGSETLNIITEDVSQLKYDKVMSLASADNTILNVDIDNSELNLHDVFQVRHNSNHHTKISETLLSPSPSLSPSPDNVQMRPSSRLISVSQMSTVSESTSASEHTTEKKGMQKKQIRIRMSLSSQILLLAHLINLKSL